MCRAYVPRWAHDPLSGAGAALFGGRWNARGVPCLYAARELSTAWAEYILLEQNDGWQLPPRFMTLETMAGRTDEQPATLTHIAA